MTNITICRDTGKRSIQPGGQSKEGNDMLDKLADMIVEWGINTGVIENVIRQTKAS